MTRRADPTAPLVFVAAALILAVTGCGKQQDAPGAAPQAAKVGAATPAATSPAASLEAAPAPGAAATKPAPGAPAAAAPAPAAVAALAALGRPAPDFTLEDLAGKQHTLSSFAGKTVVLEWYNPDCPFVVKAHREGPLREMAQQAIATGVVWLAINSGAPGTQGHGVERNTKSVQEYGLVHPVLLDEDGATGKRYGATATPHMFVVDAQGTLVYQGGLDNAPLGEVSGGGEYKNYVALALADLAAGRAVAIRDSPPWGCSVKYGM
jgi:peroxiredoxin